LKGREFCRRKMRSSVGQRDENCTVRKYADSHMGKSVLTLKVQN
jgi:hypothetical protein